MGGGGGRASGGEYRSKSVACDTERGALKILKRRGLKINFFRPPKATEIFFLLEKM